MLALQHARSDRYARGVARLVLIVDDDKYIRNAIVAVLKVDGYAAVTAEDGAMALAILRARREEIGVILLDLRMPVMDGVTFLAERAADPSLVGIPACVISADADASARCVGLFVSCVLRKPFDGDDLIRVVKTFIP